MALGVPGRLTLNLLTTTRVSPPSNASKWQMEFNSAFKELRPRIISTFSTTRVVGRQLYAPAAFTPGDIPGTLFQMLSRPQGTWFCRKEPRKKSPVTPQGTLPQTPLTNCTDKNLPTYPTQVVHAIGQPVSRRLLTAYVRVRAQASSCGIYGC